MQLTLNISGFESNVHYPDLDVDQVHLPLVRQLSDLAQAKGRPTVVFLCAPPGTGKSTVAAFWQHLASTDPKLTDMQVLPMDGFHYPNSYLDANCTTIEDKQVILRQIKGAYQTFDLAGLQEKIRSLGKEGAKWPYYDRQLHDPVPDAITVDSQQPLLIIEGNWLLLDKPGWRDLKQLADLTIFIDTQPEFLQQRLVERKMRGGLSREQAEAFYLASDGKNVDTVLEQSLPADVTLFMDQDGSYKIKPAS